MKDKGFTLIELLAVIVILAVISMIAIPIILNVIQDTKKSAFERTVEMTLNAAKLDYAALQLKSENRSKVYSMPEDLELNGEKPNGEVAIYPDNTSSLNLSLNGYCATKEREDEKFTVFECNTDDSSNSNIVYSYGDTIKLNLDGTNETEWVVLKKDEGSKTITLISKDPMLSDPIYSNSTNKYVYNSLNDLTSTWVNLPVINSYNYKVSDDYYVNISNGVSTIKLENTPDTENNTRARLLTFEEFYDTYEKNLKVVDLNSSVRETFPEVQNVIQSIYSLYKFTDIMDQTASTKFSDGSDMSWLMSFNDEDNLLQIGGQFMGYLEQLANNGAMQDYVPIGQNGGSTYYIYLDVSNYRMGLAKEINGVKDEVYVNMPVGQDELIMISNKLSNENSNKVLDEYVKAATYGDISNDPRKNAILNGLPYYLNINSVGQYISLGGSLLSMEGATVEQALEYNFGIPVSNIESEVKSTQLYNKFMSLMEDMVKIEILQNMLNSYGVNNLNIVYQYLFKNVMTRTQSIFYFADPRLTMDLPSLAQNLTIYDQMDINPVITISYSTFDKVHSSPEDDIININPETKLKSVILANNLNEEGTYYTDEDIDFSSANYYYNDKDIVGDNGNGFYQDSNDSSIYYFRGNVENNNIEFANERWKIVEINSDGSIKIVLIKPSVTTYYGNTSNYLNSNVKEKIENWYDANIKSLFGKYVSDPGFCLDAYSGTPTHSCSSENLYSVKNGKLNSPVGLLTVDEAIYSGGAIDQLNGNYYLYASETPWWLMTPGDSNTAYAGYSGLNLKETTDTFAIRPVINLSPYVEWGSGDGSYSDPYTIKMSD